MNVVMLFPDRVMETPLGVSVRCGWASTRDWTFFMNNVLEALWFEEPKRYLELLEMLELNSAFSPAAGFYQAMAEVIEAYSQFYGNAHASAVERFAELEAEVMRQGPTEPEQAYVRRHTAFLMAGTIYGLGDVRLLTWLLSAFEDKLPAEVGSRADGYRFGLVLMLLKVHDQLERCADPDHVGLIQLARKRVGNRGISRQDLIDLFMSTYGSGETTAASWLLWLQESWLLYVAEDDPDCADDAPAEDVLWVYLAPRFQPPAAPAERPKGVSVVAA
jgi:hypothetical protein